MMWIFYRRAEPDSRRSELLAGAGHPLHHAARAAQARPRRARSRLHLSVHVPPLVSARRSDPALNDVLIQAGRTLAHALQGKGRVPALVRRRGFAVHRHHDERRHHLLRRARDRRRASARIAMRHCLTTRRVLVRGDGSTAHEGMFDLDTGEFLRQTTHQGYRGDSCWSRGLAWALYGFTSCYEYTPRSALPRHGGSLRRLLSRAHRRRRRSAVGFRCSAGNSHARGHLRRCDRGGRIFRLCQVASDPMKGHFYWSAANRILRSLCDKYLAQRCPVGRHPQGRRLSPPQRTGRR